MDVRLALSGFGNVGKGIASLLLERGDLFQRRYGVRLLLSGVADRGGAIVSRQGLDPSSLLETKTRLGTVAAGPGGEPGLAGPDFLQQAEALVLVEAASTNFENAEPGWSYVREALAQKMDVVLASKGALVLHFGEIAAMTRDRGRRVLFAATVGAPLPVLELAERVLVGADMTGFEGILNGTTNQILTAMSEGASYEEGVRQAQAMGIAETDPTLDVDGWDAAAKALIVSNAVLGASLRLEEVRREGIRGIARSDLDHARNQGETIKLIARGTRAGGSVVASVAPEQRPLGDALGRLRNAEMGIVFNTEPLGQIAVTTHHFSHQTGGIVTAMTVLRDVVNLARERGWGSPPPG